MYILPMPQKITFNKSVFWISYDTEIILSTNSSQECFGYANILKDEIFQYTGMELSINRGTFCKNAIYLEYIEEWKEQEYHIEICEEKIHLQAAHNAGMLYAIQTLRQIIRQGGAEIACLSIHDCPLFENRGVYYDVTRCRIPTMDYLKKLADTLSFYKINQLHLYIEHTFMFKNMSEVWRDDTPLTANDILEFDQYCAEKNIELVPSIATFGHLYKVLRTNTYRHLCEREDLCLEPFGFVDRMEHHTLDVSNQESGQLIISLIDEYMALFRSDKFNICGDETFDLGKGKSKELLEEIGEQKMYVQYIQKLCGHLVSKGKTPMLWGDIICKFPEAIKELPRQTIYLNWGYDRSVDETNTQKLAMAGARFYNCPGVSGWDQFVNQFSVSYENIQKMCTYAKKYNAEGILNTDWGDCGHINHPDMSIVGIIYGAALSWNCTVPEFEIMNQQISVIEFFDKEETFVKKIADISELWIYKWRNFINFFEHKEAAWMPEKMEELQNASDKLESKKKELLAYISKMDGSKRNIIRPYIVAVDGMILLQKIGISIIDRENQINILDKAQKDELAQKLETWFHYYKTEWRKVSRESELYRIQQVIFAAADYLRE